MKNYRGILQDLEQNVLEEFKTMVLKRDYNFAQDVIDKEYTKEEQKELQEWLNNEDFVDMYEYDFFEFMPQVWFNGRKGEKMGYVLSVTKDGIYLMGEEYDTAFFVDAESLSSIDTRIHLLDEMENL